MGARTAALKLDRPITSDPKKISFIANQMWACAWYRCHVPGIELLRRGHDVVLHENMHSLAGRQPDIFVVQSLVHPSIYEHAMQTRARGGLFVLDLDDEPFSLHPANPAYGYWNQPHVQDLLVRLLRGADAVTTTTPELAASLERFSRRVVVLPNMLPGEHWPTRLQPRPPGDPIVVGWAGSGSHAPDLHEIEPVLQQVLDRFEHVEVHIAGAHPGWFRIEHPRMKLLPAVKIEQYPQLLSGFDIAVAPLLDNKFNRAKSDLKLVEYGMLGIPFVASNSPSYGRFVKNGENGFLAKTAKDWLQRISSLIVDRELRDRLGQSARRSAENRTIERHIGLWEKAYGIEG